VFAAPDLKLVNEAFTVLVRANPGPGARLGMAISRKRIRLAVQRNRVKRIIRESFRQQRSQLPCVDIVVLARDAAGSLANATLARVLNREWSQIQLRLGSPASSSTEQAES